MLATIVGIDQLHTWIGGISLAIWIYLLLFRGMFWRVAPLLRAPTNPVNQPARLVAVIPARDEAETIGMAVQSLREQTFDGELHIIVVDDNSSDATAEIARAAGATVVNAGPLPPGWTGKLWALSQGIEAAEPLRPDFLLLTDADIEHGPTSVRDLLAHNLPMASVMVKLRCESLAERLLVPAFVFFFFKLYPPKWIADPYARTAAAAGGCILIRADLMKEIGGIAAIRNELIDDCALARQAKKHGPIWLGMTRTTRSLRAYGTFASIWNMVARTAFTQLEHSPLLLIGTGLGMFLAYLAPPIYTLFGSWTALAAWAAMSLAYTPMLRFYNQPLVMAPLLPMIALFYLGATIHSAIRYWIGTGGQWKGRVQDARQ
jgi:hopene-associated glycosyltransferase HpnB